MSIYYDMFDENNRMKMEYKCNLVLPYLLAEVKRQLLGIIHKRSVVNQHELMAGWFILFTCMYQS